MSQKYTIPKPARKEEVLCNCRCIRRLVSEPLRFFENWAHAMNQIRNVTTR